MDRSWCQVTCGLSWVAYATLALVHPESGIIFAFASGMVYALRLPEPERTEALKAGLRFGNERTRYLQSELTNVGSDWVLGDWCEEEYEWCLAAYRFAGEFAGMGQGRVIKNPRL
jgi:hypothetical protein